VGTQDQDLPFGVKVLDEHDSRVDELVALVGDHAVAHAAFAETVRRRAGRIVTLPQKTRLLVDSRRG
jgi:hypothetical protein